MIVPVFAALVGVFELLLILLVFAVVVLVPVVILVLALAASRSRSQPASPQVPLSGPAAQSDFLATSKDAEQVRLLGLFHFVLGGLGLLGGLFLFLHFLFMHTILSHAGSPMPRMSHLFIFFYFLMALCLLAGIALNVLSGLFLLQRKARTFSIIVAGLNCLQFPFGTALGVFTIIVLMRDNVRALYSAEANRGVGT